MSDLKPEDRALLDLARDGHEPTDGDRGRVRLALLMQLGVGTGLAGTTAATSKAATALVLTKVLATLAVAGAIGGTGVITYHMTHPTRAQVVAMTSSGAQLPAARLAERGEALGAHLADLPDLVIQPQSAQEATSLNTVRAKRNAELMENRSAAPASPLAAWPAGPPRTSPQEATIAPPGAPTTAGPTVPTLPPTTLEAETRLVRGGIAALHAGDAARALALLDEHARAFPNGALAEERAAERVVALGDLHRCDEAQAAAAAFLREHPHSPLAARVRESCARTPNR